MRATQNLDFVLTGTAIVHAAGLMQVGQQSKAAMSLCLWVRAMDTYATVYRIVEPKRQTLAAAQAALDASNAALAEKQMQLQAIKDKVAALQQQLTDTQKQLAALQFQVRACQWVGPYLGHVVHYLEQQSRTSLALLQWTEIQPGSCATSRPSLPEKEHDTLCCVLCVCV